ncbi:MAG: hypothetical protein SNH73_00265 [Rikenellaceae bacterium]
MEEGFDISHLKWLIMFAVFVLYRFFSAKPPKVDQEEPMSEELQWPIQEVEQGVEQEMKQGGVKQEVKPKAVQTPNVSFKGDLSRSDIEEQSHEDSASIAEEFDLQKAVIMSEILTRKYDE